MIVRVSVMYTHSALLVSTCVFPLLSEPNREVAAVQQRLKEEKCVNPPVVVEQLALERGRDNKVNDKKETSIAANSGSDTPNQLTFWSRATLKYTTNSIKRLISPQVACHIYTYI